MVLKEGQSFKKNDIIAKNPDYFMGDNKDNITYSFGKLSKVAITSGDFTFEDSSIVTKSLSESMKSKITMKIDHTFGPNTTIEKFVKVGDKVKTGDPLIIFENSFEDDSINDLLEKIGSDFNETIKELTKNIIKSKYNGEIVGINIYYNKDIEEFSPSLQKIIKEYVKKGKAKKAKLDNIIENGEYDINIPSTEKQEGNKIKGVDVDGVMLEIFIEYEDKLGIGDKLTYYTALKSIIADVIPEGEEPYSSYNEDEVIEAIVSPLSIVSRMTEDIYFALYLNKALIGLKDKIKEIYNS